jgi:hypothetical protein
MPLDIPFGLHAEALRVLWDQLGQMGGLSVLELTLAGATPLAGAAQRPRSVSTGRRAWLGNALPGRLGEPGFMAARGPHTLNGRARPLPGRFGAPDVSVLERTGSWDEVARQSTASGARA